MSVAPCCCTASQITDDGSAIEENDDDETLSSRPVCVQLDNAADWGVVLVLPVAVVALPAVPQAVFCHFSSSVTEDGSGNDAVVVVDDVWSHIML